MPLLPVIEPPKAVLGGRLRSDLARGLFAPGWRCLPPGVVARIAWLPLRQLRRHVHERHRRKIGKQLPPPFHLIISQLIETLDQRTRPVDRILGVTHILRPLVILHTKENGPQFLNREPNHRVPRVNYKVRWAKRRILLSEDRATEHRYTVRVGVEGATGGVDALPRRRVPPPPGGLRVLRQTPFAGYLASGFRGVLDN